MSEAERNYDIYNRELLAIGHPGALDPQFIEERMTHRLHRAQTRLWRVLEKLRDQIDCLRRRARPEHLVGKPLSVAVRTHTTSRIRRTFENG